MPPRTIHLIDFGQPTTTPAPSGRVFESGLSGSLSEDSQSIIIGQGGTGVLDGNTLKNLYIKFRLINVASPPAVLNCTIKLNGVAVEGTRLVKNTGVIDSTHLRLFGGTGPTYTMVEMWVDLKAGWPRGLRTEVRALANNTHLNEDYCGNYVIDGGPSEDNVVSIEVNSNLAGGLGSGSEWAVWSDREE